MSPAQIVFAPAFGWPWFGALAAAALLATLPSLLRRARGAMFRCLGFLLLLAALAGPAWTAETRRPLRDIALLLIDRSQSMSIGNRTSLVNAAAAALQSSAAGIDLRSVEVPPATDGGTALFSAMNDALAGIPPAQLAGIVAITDGEITDAPASRATDPPFTALLAAAHEETDRELRLLDTPGYGLVGQTIKLRLTVLDHGANDRGEPVPITVTEDGALLTQQTAAIGGVLTLDLPVRHAGPNIIQASVPTLPGEISPLNNQAILTVNGIQRRLDVLLISGSPDLNERSWRLLLKSDPATQLVHFTILRTPSEAVDADPDALALVPFPVETLFNVDLHRFDLIILDRFDANGLLPPQYLINIVAYVRGGGALLAELGPEFNEPGSLAASALRDILSALPADAGTLTQSFTPTVTSLGARHPVTAPLAGMKLAPWYRMEAATPTFGDVLMTGAGNAPLLILGSAGSGRVGMLLSDQLWLWTRGGAHAGPALPLLRRVVHWLLRDPALEPEALSARFDGNTLIIDHRTLSPSGHDTVTVTAPGGTTSKLNLPQTAPAGESLALSAPQRGVWKVSLGPLTAYAANPFENPQEFQDLAATAKLFKPIATTIWLGQTPTPPLPHLIRPRHATAVTGTSDIPLLPPVPTMLLALVLLTAAWWRESL